MRVPPFEEPQSIVKFVGKRQSFPTQEVEQQGLQFLRLLEREAPVKLDFTFSDVSPGSETPPTTFTDLEMDPQHVLQVFIGVTRGGAIRVQHPNDTEVLDWDQQTLDQVDENDTRTLEYEDSPIDRPSFELWVAPTTENLTPALTAENILSTVRPLRTIDVRVLMIGAKYTYDFVDDPSLLDDLRHGRKPAKFAWFGGGI